MNQRALRGIAPSPTADAVDEQPADAGVVGGPLEGELERARRRGHGAGRALDAVRRAFVVVFEDGAAVLHVHREAAAQVAERDDHAFGRGAGVGAGARRCGTSG